MIKSRCSLLNVSVKLAKLLIIIGLLLLVVSVFNLNIEGSYQQGKVEGDLSYIALFCGFLIMYITFFFSSSPIKFGFWEFHFKISQIFTKVRKTYPDPSKQCDLDSLLAKETIRKNLNLFLSFLEPDMRGLDAGCGRGILSALLASKGFKMWACDLELPVEEQMRFKKKGWQIPSWKILHDEYEVSFKIVDLRKPLPYKDESFDFILLYAVLEHIYPQKELLGVIARLRRTLKKGGYLFIADLPNYYSYTELLAEKFGLGAHKNRFREHEVREWFNIQSGWKVELWKKYDFFPRYLHPYCKQINNLLFPLTLFLDRVLQFIPLFEKIAHHYVIILKKS